jgi:hypothetical protein
MKIGHVLALNMSFTLQRQLSWLGLSFILFIELCLNE